MRSVAQDSARTAESLLPDADIALAHLLMLLTDEPGFLAAANPHPCGPLGGQLWNTAYRRRIAEARTRRAHEEAA